MQHMRAVDGATPPVRRWIEDRQPAFATILDYSPFAAACVPDNSATPYKKPGRLACMMTMPLFKRDMAMGSILLQLHWRHLLATARSMSLAPYFVIAGLMALLIWTVFMSDAGWKPAGDFDAPDAGVLAMVFGTMFSLVVGAVVMTLVFYDDTAARLAPQERDHSQS